MQLLATNSRRWKAIKYIGIDIGKKKCQACLMREDGSIVDEFPFSNDSNGISLLLSKIDDGQCKAVLEATANMWVRIYNALEGRGIEVKLANPSMTKAIAYARIKTDKISARILADLLRADLIYECYVPTCETRNARNLLRHRLSIVKIETMVKNQVHALLDMYEIECNYNKNILGSKGMAMLSSAKMDGDDDLIRDTQLEHLECIKQCIDKISARIALRASDSEYVRIMMSMTGIDYYTALLLASEIGDIARFPTPKHLVSWAGLCPELHDSGESKYYGKMKKNANRRVKWGIVQAAHVAAMHDPRMKEYYERNAKKMHKNKAAVKVANKMMTIIWHMLTNKQMYMQRNDRLYSHKINKMSRIAN